MPDREKVIKGLRDIDMFIAGRLGYEKAKNFLRTIDDALALLKEQDTLLKEYRNTIKDGYEALTNATKIIKSEPQIVRCKDCKRKNTTACIIYCIGASPRDDWFCADGERRTEDA